MLIVRGNVERLQLVTGSAGTIRVHLDVMQATNAAPPVLAAFPDFGPQAVISTATTTTIVDGTGLSSGAAYNVKGCSIFNDDATVSQTVTVQTYDGTNTSVKAKVLLLVGERLELDEVGSWRHYDSNGGEYPATILVDYGNIYGISGTLAETLPRTIAGVNLSALTSGTLFLQLIYLRAGQKINTISFCSGSTAAGTPTNRFFCLYDINRNLLAQTANQTTTAWAANTVMSTALTATYTVPTTGLYYVGIMVSATTVPSLAGVTAAGNAALRSAAPIVSGNSSTGLTTTLPSTGTAITGAVNSVWAAVS